jgi:ribosome-associated protein
MKTNSSAKEQSLRPATASRQQPRSVTGDQADELEPRILLALSSASDKKAINTVVLDLREIASFTDYFVIASGSNERQVQAIADEVYERLKQTGSTAARIEGYKNAEWILLDYGDFVVHVFDEQARKFYDLERLWRESKRVALPRDLAGGSSSLRTES